MRDILLGAQAALPAASEIDLLSRYYELVLKWNKRLHLTTLTRPQEFFERHILESIFSESLILPSVNQVWDLGSGLGVPGMVIAILRPDLDTHLVEAGRNKALFLEETATRLDLKNVTVVESRFETLDPLPEESCLTVRAIEKMGKLIPEILRLGARSSQILIFGSKDLEARARIYINDKRKIECALIPGSNRRYVINITRST
ncbi:MAG TPA: 16S rRNA (guanine(527)-N(7))-methyltransferase RsmG [Blastocatellia bacterium]|nr:16S rRNA (guanine(527)-N(7))-methyltransferase RsmG [Blastocatellia bacterium]